MLASCICLVMSVLSCVRRRLVAERLAGLEHVPDPRLGLFLLRELDEVLALQAQQPFLVDHGSAVDFAAAQHGGDAGGDLVVVLRSEEHTSELQSLMRISYAVFCLK